MPDGGSYSDYIREVYIDNIRSVLIIDDDYPTLSEFLTNEKNEKTWRLDPGKVHNIIKHFRDDRKWLVDIHDGNNISLEDELVIAQHLYQTDLLILDYELEKHEIDQGIKARHIAKELSKTPHFNLVIVHSSKDKPTLFKEMLLSFLPPITKELHPVQETKITELLEELEDKNEGIKETIFSAFSEQTYLYYYKHVSSLRQDIETNKSEYSEILHILSGLKLSEKVSVIKFLARKLEKELIKKKAISSIGSPTPRWSNTSTDYQWIKVGNAFIAFATKEEAEKETLPDILLHTLAEWAPMPSRLIMSKIRVELESKGVLVEDEVLEDPHKFAIWYRDLLEKTDKLSRFVELQYTIDRHLVGLGKSIFNEVLRYSNQLIKFEKSDENIIPNDIVKTRFNINLNNDEELIEAVKQHNSYVCTHPPSGWHLTTGHILGFADALWLCLSPACDLVPNQKTSGHFGDVEGFMPFLGVRLYKAPDSLSKEQINSNKFIFLKTDSGITSYCFHDPAKASANPHWYPLYAFDGGAVNNLGEIEILKSETCADNGLKFSRHSAKIMYQLYPEYAINLMQGLGQNLSRVGLDYKSYPVPKK